MSNIDDYYIKMTTIPRVTQQGSGLNTFELADTKAEGISPLPEFTGKKTIVDSDEALKIEQLEALSATMNQSEAGPGALAIEAKSSKLTDKQKLVGFGFLAYLLLKFLK